MHVTLAGVVLFLHIFIAIVAFMMAGVLHAAFQALARARDVREGRSWAVLLHRLDPLLPVSALLLLGLGAWLIHLSGGEFSWHDGWVITAVVSLVLIEALAGALLAPKLKAIVGEIQQANDGPISESLHRQIIDPISWHVGHIATFGFAGVVFLMAAKPSGAWAPVIVVIGAVVGVAVSRAQLRSLPAAGAPVPDQRKVGEAV